MSRRHLRPDRKQQRRDEAEQRQAEYDALSDAEKQAKSNAWRPKA